MSRPPSELESALRAVTHDVRATLGVLFSALDELTHEASDRGFLPGRVSELLAMMRRAASRLQIIADATELVRQHDESEPLPVLVDLSELVREVVSARVAVERAEPLGIELSLPPAASTCIAVPWCRYVCSEAVAFVVRRAQQRLSLSLVDEEDCWVLSVGSDAPARPGPIGAPFAHPLGFAASLAHNFGGSVEIAPAETAHVVVRIPRRA